MTRTSPVNPDRRAFLKVMGLGLLESLGRRFWWPAPAKASPVAPRARRAPRAHRRRCFPHRNQLASVSKPLAPTVAAGAVGSKALKWTDPVVSHTPAFSLKDSSRRTPPSRTCCRTRAALRTGSSDLLEDLGFDWFYILSHLNQQPLDSFRSSYNYTNFGYTAGAQAVADAMKMTWPTRFCSSRLTWPIPATATRTTKRRRTGRSSMCRPETGPGWPNTTATPVRRPRPAAPAPQSGTWPAGCVCSSPTAAMTASRSLARRPSAPHTFRMSSRGARHPGSARPLLHRQLCQFLLRPADCRRGERRTGPGDGTRWRDHQVPPQPP
jgi:hypothetical protein